MRFFLALLLLLALYSCKKDEIKKLNLGTYRAVLHIQDQEEIPFLFEVKNDTLLTIFNADEVIEVDEIFYKNDSITIQTPVFEGYIQAKIESDTLKGYFLKPSLDRIVPFSAYKNSKRFIANTTPKQDINGNWETVFSQNSESERYVAKGIFKQEDEKVTGTFRTTTGDYRYLEGIVDGDSLKLSTFDGAHAFLFKAKVSDSIINGFFYSGNHWKESFIAKRNEDYELPEEEKLTYLKDGYDQFYFSFPDTRGRLVSSSDPEFDDKVIVIQIMGTWCPNCLDESKYLVNYLQNNPNDDLQIVGLAFEVAKTRELAYQRINRLKERINIPYPILLAQFSNEANKEMAHQKLPMLNHVISYPTTIFIDKNKKVRKIHTGFNGPATGKKYDDFKEEFEQFVTQLLNEK